MSKHRTEHVIPRHHFPTGRDRIYIKRARTLQTLILPIACSSWHSDVDWIAHRAVIDDFGMRVVRTFRLSFTALEQVVTTYSALYSVSSNSPERLCLGAHQKCKCCQVMCCP